MGSTAPEGAYFLQAVVVDRDLGSSGADGFIAAWVNGVRKMDYSGPTLYAGQGCYLKLANYRSAFRKPSSVIHGHVLAARHRTPFR